MTDAVSDHYIRNEDLAEEIAMALRSSGRDPGTLAAPDLAPVDEFHIRGREATLELAARTNLTSDSRVLDIGSGLGGPARTVAEAYGCHVTGVDLAQAFCDAAAVMSDWVGLRDDATFCRGDVTDLPFGDDAFDAAMTIHVGMNVPDKHAMFREVRRVVRPGGRFAVYDVLEGEGGDVLFPVPWAREPSISHLATPDEMETLLAGAGFELLDALDSSDESEAWFEEMATRMAMGGLPPVSFRPFLGEDFPDMARNQVRNLRERRIRTVSYVAQA